METLNIESSVASQLVFLADMGLLQITFRSGKVYRYEADVDVWAEVKAILEEGSSFGKFFNKVIRSLPTWKRLGE